MKKILLVCMSFLTLNVAFNLHDDFVCNCKCHEYDEQQVDLAQHYCEICKEVHLNYGSSLYQIKPPNDDE